MDPETELPIFEPYFSTKSPAEASGLGLATVHGIVGQSGGTISVRTAPAEGAVFTVRLPQGASLRPLAQAATLD
jgi:signal transduction histidine kinase